MRVAVMGTGGVGGYFGGLLARDGQEVTFIARGEHLEAIRRRGLRVLSDLHGEFTVRAPATDDTGQVGPVDLVLYAVKMYHNRGAIPALPPMVGPETVVLTLQNGIDNADLLAQALGRRHVMAGMSIVQARIREPGVVEQRGHVGRVVFGELEGGVTPRGRRLQEVFQRAGWNSELSDDVTVALWRKFIYLTGSAGVNALARVTYGELRTTPETRSLIRQAYQEIVDVGRAAGVDLPADIMDWCMSALDDFPAEGMATLAKDFMEGRPVELEGLTGTVVRMGRELGVATPVNEAIYALLKPLALRIEKGRRGG